MATHDYVIANGTGSAVRSDLNNALAAIVSQNSSSSEPGTTYAYQIWVDTNTNTIKLRNSSNDAWLDVGTTAGGARSVTDAVINSVIVGNGAGDVGSNTVVGKTALDSNTSGARNTAVGEDALTANTTGDDNIAIGHNSLDANTTGDANTAVGKDALSATSTASSNTAVGKSALAANTGSSNTACGKDALLVNTSGTNNTAVGAGALADNTASESTAVGYNALNNNTSCLLYTSPSPRDRQKSRMPSSA